MVDVTLDEADGSMALVKIQAETWELNIRAPKGDLMQLREVRDAHWDARRSLAIGTCADAPVYWATSEGRVTILIGPDDEAWDIAVVVPLVAVDEIVSLVQQRT
ncbi:hypothetical protein [Actinomadura rudentiformis]|uniref:Uncharacterized protein n=1 Tax=Actinomadura rudentiformis TaxID=359158 RepID=A0A6H9YX64_9ACTN|nr:hypothetical protein [Actinomadura rudentiformis]KAB2348571.1 hypothetical protein F8566_17515 [Actinomadura rudentiformis]